MFTSSKKRLFDGKPRPGEAIIISFFGGDPYYARCAQRLAEQCDKFDLAYDICEYHPDTADGWANICRKKIGFYSQKLREYGSAVMWVDVDAQIIADPRRVLRSTADVGAFLRNFRYLVGFDPMQYGRLLQPGYLLFSYTARTLAFMEQLEALDRTSDPASTDDFVLQEALSRHAGQVSFELFPPAYIVTSNGPLGHCGALFRHGDSGNVKANMAIAPQHTPPVLAVDRQRRVLVTCADEHIVAKNFRQAVAFLEKAAELDPDDGPTAVKLLNAYRALGWKKKRAELIAKSEANPVLAPYVLRERYKAASNGSNLELAARLAEQITSKGSDADRAFVESRQYRLSFEETARERQIAEADRVPLWWWERPYPGNLGDMINPYVIEGLTGVPPRFARRGPRVLAIGSIIKFAGKGDRVWGAGCPSADQAIEPGAIFHAVRGPLTRKLVLQAGGACEPVYGDPAWFLPLLYPDRRRRKTHRVGLVRHFTHRPQPIALASDVREIEIIRSGRAGIEAFLDELLSCEAIVSTSLHGIIIANAYGIPARLATFTASDRQVHGDGMKFEDYFASVGRRGIRPLDLSGIEVLSGRMATQCTDNPEHGIDLEALLAAAPFPVNPSVTAGRKASKVNRLLQLFGVEA